MSICVHLNKHWTRITLHTNITRWQTGITCNILQEIYVSSWVLGWLVISILSLLNYCCLTRHDIPMGMHTYIYFDLGARADKLYIYYKYEIHRTIYFTFVNTWAPSFQRWDVVFTGCSEISKNNIRATQRLLG